MAPLHYSLSSPGVKIAACFISASTPSLLSILETESQTLQSDWNLELFLSIKLTECLDLECEYLSSPASNWYKVEDGYTWQSAHLHSMTNCDNQKSSYWAEGHSSKSGGHCLSTAGLSVCHSLNTHTWYISSCSVKYSLYSLHTQPTFSPTEVELLSDPYLLEKKTWCFFELGDWFSSRFSLSCSVMACRFDTKITHDTKNRSPCNKNT